jgi:oligosaccharide repeat unit polymerase
MTIPARKRWSRFEQLRYRNNLIIVGLVIMLVGNGLCYYLGVWQIYWGSCAVILFLTAVPFLVTWKSPLAGYFCFPNIFVALLALFHIGYYVPVRLGLVDGLDYMPSVDSRTGDLAMVLYCCALLSFSIGVSCGVSWASRKLVCDPASDIHKISTAKAITWAGAVIILLDLFLFVVFLAQTGSLSKILRLSYTDYWDFLTYEDPRFLMTFVQFMPVGLLLVYVGVWSRKTTRRNLIYLDISSVLYVVWLILIGARGPAFLFAVAVLYVRHLCYGRISNSAVVAAALAFLFAIPVVASYRNLPTGERAAALRHADLNPLSGILEMGGTYRTLYTFSEIFGSPGSPLMMGASYIKAVQHLLPNLGMRKDSSQTGVGYYRSTVWITDAIDPLLASQNGGLGSTGIGEPFANFGFFGVVLFFLVSGFAFTVLEMYSLGAKSIISTAILAAIFIPVNWYVRDDIYGMARPVVWCLVVIGSSYFVLSRKIAKRQESRVHPKRPRGEFVISGQRSALTSERTWS